MTHACEATRSFDFVGERFGLSMIAQSLDGVPPVGGPTYLLHITMAEESNRRGGSVAEPIDRIGSSPHRLYLGSHELRRVLATNQIPGAKAMKITDVVLKAYSKRFRTPIVRPARTIDTRDILIVRILTDGGLTGLGFLTGLGLAGGSEIKVLYTIAKESLRPLLIGEDPLDNERLWSKMYRSTYRFGRRGAVIRAMSAIDIALWDIKGLVARLPLHKLIGGFAERVPAYASGGYAHEIELLLEEIERYLERGFAAFKMHIGGGPLREDIKRVEAVRDLIGSDCKLMVDATGNLRLKEAVALIKELQRFGILWVEEPLPLDDVAGYARLASLVDVPIAAGGGEYTRYGFLPLIQTGAVEIIQPDSTRTGGITEWLRIAALASAYEVRIAPHAVAEVHTHLVAGIPNGFMVEFFDHDHPLQEFISEVFGRPVNPHDGWVVPSDEAGLGLRFREEVAEPFEVSTSG